ncbi:MAG: 16S rRNA (cytidine(1402)-2'-O)-methyltransferase [Gammaproteobacteria bacterium]|nr:16S rRNA (cytidine(1402)-2'-O)-methyltransferase [Gammaproteobacteria bacterium]|tara:strand:- start:33047 stop:33874 length:828 start_codon:yes stop_codon:yes gene_type:complete
MTGKLFIVGTPIGNLDDITIRAIEVLNNCDYILAESSVRTSKLLNKYSIKKKIITFNKDNEKRKVKNIISDLSSGKDIALLSDAGTPSISDPGFEILRHFDNRFITIPIPGPSALTSSLSVSPIPTNNFIFLGFLPRKNSEIDNKIKLVKNLGIPAVLFENKRRVNALLERINNICGDDVQICFFRELTKIHEEIQYGKIKDIIKRSKESDYNGEFTIIFKSENKKKPEIEELSEKVKQLSKSFSNKEIIDILSLFSNHSKKELYKFVLNIRQKT